MHTPSTSLWCPPTSFRVVGTVSNGDANFSKFLEVMIMCTDVSRHLWTFVWAHTIQILTMKNLQFFFWVGVLPMLNLMLSSTLWPTLAWYQNVDVQTSFNNWKMPKTFSINCTQARLLQQRTCGTSEDSDSWMSTYYELLSTSDFWHWQVRPCLPCIKIVTLAAFWGQDPI